MKLTQDSSTMIDVLSYSFVAGRFSPRAAHSGSKLLVLYQFCVPDQAHSMAHTDFAGTVAARMKQLGYGQLAISKVLRPLSGAEAACSASFSHVTPIEEELMRHLHASGLGVKRIAAAVGRSTDTISKHLFRRCKAKPARVGPKVCITDSNYKRIFKGYKRLLKNARGKEVTVKMVKKELKLKCSVKTLSRAFWARGVHFRPLYEKPDLSPQDAKDRLAWALAHAHRSPAQWGRALVVKLGSFKF